MSQTIYALASAPGRAGVAVVRVSGPDAFDSLAALSEPMPLPDIRQASLRKIKNPVQEKSVDEAVVVRFAGPHSFTGEDVVEYHVHGGRAVIDALLAALAAQAGHRLAEPGEFTRRGFENGRMDLTAAEAVADLIAAETEAQREQALAQMGGALARLYDGWAGRLSRALAHLEADLDFSDEDLPEGVAETVKPQLRQLEFEIRQHLNDGRRGERLREGVKIAVIGAPNAGKSSLVNALAQRDVAIVSDIPGTTRDVIEVHLNLGGYPVILADTAGLRPDQIGHSGQDRIEQEGIARALRYAQDADVVLLLFDGAAVPSIDPDTVRLIDSRSVCYASKADIMRADARVRGMTLPAFSVATGAGFDRLIHDLTGRVAEAMGSADRPYLTRARHRVALEESCAALTRAGEAMLPELIAEDARLALRALGRITGRVDVENLLDIIFRDFCIGK
ncbi:MAG: tRNA uridine-5-carboxymethylaminomethyl(34) synthesis GTPase MnmE [Rhodospirillales bacterium]|nr:tRNA uridine-5-carboxymethylaminomethyl(34) synthesis GTPase MnmE [Alphaproteobacteria bacterium]MCB9986619.1 tRNA uridine-5-carboxymethylaminomethyl(34) synthesis GTPase MnmE [Rhodospirillales bacterium]USO06851.1 MAG: tRNA uridine-5-carboxymethylaminomethyl(34) synthesis GTPase MnmE [Rhodospirillales bacterium]